MKDRQADLQCCNNYDCSHNINGKCPACGFEAPLSDEEESQSILICDNCEAGFPGYMYVATKTNKLKGDET